MKISVSATICVLALSACTDTGLPLPGDEDVARAAPSPEALEIQAIEASIDTALAPLSETAPVRLSPVKPVRTGAGALAPLPSCTATETVPALYKEVEGEIEIVPAKLAEDGSVAQPPVYRRGQVPKLVRPEVALRFDAPCPDALTPEFVASLQRALAVRGFYTGEITGALDPATAAAIRRFQAGHGLDSAQLSLDSARKLGLITVGDQG